MFLLAICICFGRSIYLRPLPIFESGYFLSFKSSLYILDILYMKYIICKYFSHSVGYLLILLIMPLNTNFGLVDFLCFFPILYFVYFCSDLYYYFPPSASLGVILFPFFPSFLVVKLAC